VGVQESGSTMQRIATAETVIPIDHAASNFPAGSLAWASEAGKRYRVQIQSNARDAWQDFGPEVVAEGNMTRCTRKPEGQGLFRILELP